jgi:parvulin-like peptidyl-prolyl isomerase
MPHRRPGLFLLASAGVLAAAATVAAQSPPPTATGESAAVVATIDDEPLSRTQWQSAMARLPAPPTMTAEQRLQWEARGLEQLIWERLVVAEARRQSILVDPQEIDDRLKRLVAAAKRSSLDDFLRATGSDEDQVRRRLTHDLTVERILQPRLTDAALRSVFDARRRDFDGSRVRVSHIVLRPETALGDRAITATIERAETIRREILRGDSSFADAARRWSAGPSRHRGGDIGFLGRHEPMTEEFSAAVFALAKGEVSRPIVTASGIHLATVTEIEPGRTTFEAARNAVGQEVAATALKELMARLRGRARITYSPGVPHFPRGDAARGAVVLDEPEVVEPTPPAGGLAPAPGSG